METNNKVKVRIKHGRMLISRELDTDVFAEAGEVVEVDRKWAQQLLGRKLDGYPPTSASFGAPGALPGMFADCPIELVTE